MLLLLIKIISSIIFKEMLKRNYIESKVQENNFIAIAMLNFSLFLLVKLLIIWKID